MARRYRCRCQICKKWGYTDKFYKVKRGSRNLYYCNEEEYLEWKKEDDMRIELLEFISDNIWYYDDYRMLPTVLQKQINKLASIYNYEVILLTVKEFKDTLAYWMNLDGKFNNEYGKSSYMMAIVKNNINEIYKKWKIEKKNKEQENTPHIDIDIMNNLHTTTAKNDDIDNGILEFLEEDDI